MQPIESGNTRFCNITRILAHLQLNEYPHGTSQCDLSMHRKFGSIILKTEEVVHEHTDRQTDGHCSYILLAIDRCIKNNINVYMAV